MLHHQRQATLSVLMIDPLTAAGCAPGDIWPMVNALSAAQRDHVQPFAY